MYDIVFIGAGPSTVVAVLELLRNNYSGKIGIIEKGNLIESRQPNEVINGWGGAGTYSDGKLTSSLSVGGVIPGLTQEELDGFNDYILKTLNSFNENVFEDVKELKWDKLNVFDTSPSNLTWDIHKTCHMGTEVTRNIFKNMEHFIMSHSNVTVISNTEVIDISYLDNHYNIHVVGDYHKTNNPMNIESKNVVLATGQKSKLPESIIKRFNLTNTPRAFQLGVRVEDQMNPQYEEIIKANYDFKFVKNYLMDDSVKVRVRTFCCNSGNAHVVDEKSSEGFVCFNGHAYKTPDLNNHSVNYGIICEVENLEDCKSKEQQIELMRKVNSIESWKTDNYFENNIHASRKLLNGFNHLLGIYPNEIIMALSLFVEELNKIVDLSKAYYYYPEVKLSGYMPNLNFETFESEMPGLYLIGDAAITRGIVKSSYTGYKMAQGFLNKR